MRRRPIKGYVPGVYRAAIVALEPPLRAITHRQWKGQENLPETGGYIVASNHISTFDPFPIAHAMVLAGHAPRFMAKDSLFRIPVLGKLLTWADQIPVSRGSSRAGDALSAAIEAVQAGKCIVVLPEGTFTEDPNLWPMAAKTGAARLALKTGAPLIPAAQWGAESVWPPAEKTPVWGKKRTMYVSFGEPLDIDDLREQPLTASVLREATDRLMDAITALLADIRGQEPPAERHRLDMANRHRADARQVPGTQIHDDPPRRMLGGAR